MAHALVHVRMPQVSKLESSIFTLHAIELFIQSCKYTTAPFGQFGRLESVNYINWFEKHTIILGIGKKPGRRTLRTDIQERLQAPEGQTPTDTTEMADEEEDTHTSPATEAEVDQTQTTTGDTIVPPY